MSLIEKAATADKRKKKKSNKHSKEIKGNFEYLPSNLGSIGKYGKAASKLDFEGF